jgi:hypothetical protein
MAHTASTDDLAFRDSVESGTLQPSDFGHRAHLRLAYAYLTEHDTDGAYARMRTTILAFLARNGVDPSKYHETITRAWIMAVRHFMESSADCGSADEFIDANPVMLDSKIMLSHYSAELLFSNRARTGFVEPDLEQIPEYESE